jgi:hypothetical protein
LQTFRRKGVQNAIRVDGLARPTERGVAFGVLRLEYGPGKAGIDAVRKKSFDRLAGDREALHRAGCGLASTGLSMSPFDSQGVYARHGSFAACLGQFDSLRS